MKKIVSTNCFSKTIIRIRFSAFEIKIVYGFRESKTIFWNQSNFSESNVLPDPGSDLVLVMTTFGPEIIIFDRFYKVFWHNRGPFWAPPIRKERGAKIVSKIVFK